MTPVPTRKTDGKATVAGVRALIAAGDLANARRLYDVLHARLGSVADVLVTEGLLHEAEGDVPSALACFQSALRSTPGSIQANAQTARILMRMERLEEAEASALATLALDNVNPDGLTVLAFCLARSGRIEERLDVLYRIANCLSCPEEAVWGALAELTEAGRGTQVLRVLDQRGDLPPERTAALRVETLLDLGRQRAALASILTARAAKHVSAADIIEKLLARGALGVAAAFITQALKEGPWVAKVKTEVAARATEIRDSASIETSPFEFADAIRALEILLPHHRYLSRAIDRSIGFLVRRGRFHLTRGEFAAATDHLIRAGRLAPEDLAILRLLAEAALQAGRLDRHLDTLLRIHRGAPDANSLMEAVMAAFADGRWGTVAELLSEAESENPAVAEAIERFRLGLCGRLEAFLRQDDCEGGLGMVAGLRAWMPIALWPRELRAHLLALAKRLLRSQRMAADVAACARIASLYLLIDPDDVDIGRLLGRLHMRYRRFEKALDVLRDVVIFDPHLPRDWVDLAVIHHEMKNSGERDVCIARALVIEPATPLPKYLDAPRLKGIAA